MLSFGDVTLPMLIAIEKRSGFLVDISAGANNEENHDQKALEVEDCGLEA
jgi:hypothetical protein